MQEFLLPAKENLIPIPHKVGYSKSILFAGGRFEKECSLMLLFHSSKNKLFESLNFDS